MWFTFRQVDGRAADILDLCYLICCLLMRHQDVFEGRGGAVQVFVSVGLITSCRLVRDKGQLQVGECDPAQGKVRGCSGFL